MAEITVDRKHRITIPMGLRRRLGITSGSKLEAEARGTEIVIRPAVPVKRPTEAMWGLVRGIVQRNPKKRARKAIASRKRLAW